MITIDTQSGIPHPYYYTCAKFSGGSGAVFSFSTRPTSIHHTSNINNSLLDSSTNNDLKQQYAVNNKGGANGSEDRIAIKVSWKRSNASVLKECNILQTLSSIPHVERCLGRPMDYPYENGRSIIALSPVVVMDEAATTNSGGDITSSIDKVIPGLPQRNAVQCVIETMVQMLQLGVYTIDVQPLIHRTTGEVVFIDFTEADYFSTIGDGTEAAIVGFCGEMLTLIPERLKGIAVEMLTTEINDMKENNKSLSQTIVDILESSWLE